MIDYQAIADRAVAIIGSADPLQYQAAFDVMAAETTTQPIPSEVRLNRRMLMSRLGVATAAGLLAKVAAGIDGSGLDAATVAYLKAEIDGEGLDLKHAETQGMLAGFVAASVMTQPEVDKLLALTVEMVPAWAGLKPGYVQNALQWRHGGMI